MEGLFEEMRASEQDAIARMLPTQARTKAGSYFVSPRPEFGLVIFGASWSVDRQAEHQDVQLVLENDQRGYLFGSCYSVACVEGEIGSTHRSMVWPITEEQFLQAKADRWVWSELPWLLNVRDAWMAEAEARG